MVEETVACQQMGAAVVNDVEVAGVVEVQVEVNVVGPYAHAETVFIENAQRRERPKMLANGQRRNADEADDVRHGRLP